MEQTQSKGYAEDCLDEADDENMKELLKSYGAVETDSRDESDAVVTGMNSSVFCYFTGVLTLLWKQSLQICVN